MRSKKFFAETIAILIALSIAFPTSSVGAFSGNQSAAIAIGQSTPSPYGLGGPAGGLAFDPLGNLWVADLQNSRVLGFLAPFSSNMTPSVVLGQPDLFQSWGSGWYANRMTYPTQVAFDVHGNLWVADTYNHRVIEFSPPFQNGMNASLVIGHRMIPNPSWRWADWSSTAPATGRNGLTDPEGIAFDSFGDLWVADSWNGRVLEFQPPFSNNMNASLVIGERDFTNSCNQETRPLCGDRRTLNEPKAVAFDATGNLWVTDTINLGTYATPQWEGRLLEFTSPFSDGIEAALVIHVHAGSSSHAFDSAGNLWLGCAGCTSQRGGYVSEYTPPFTEHMNPSLVMGGNTTDPTGLSFDSAGNLWIVDSNRILGFDAQVHSVTTTGGRVLFKNNVGILVPLTSIPIGMAPEPVELPLASFPYGLFNFTIQGLKSGGSVILTMTFPQPPPANLEWWSFGSSKHIDALGDEWARLPNTQVALNGSNLTLTLTGASSDGVISMLGGPALPSNVTSSSMNSQMSTPPPSTTQQSGTFGWASYVSLTAIAVMVIAILTISILVRKSRDKTSRQP